MVPAPGKTSSPNSASALPASAAARTAAVVGIGNVGTALAWAMHQSDTRVVEFVVHRAPTAAQKRLARDCKASLVALADWRESEARVVWICVPDDALAAVVEQIAGNFALGNASPRPQVYLHTSGARSYRDLATLKQAGVSLGAAHPFRSFPTAERAELSGTYFAVEGDKPARDAASAIIRGMGAVPFALQSADKALYHAFGSFASPLLIGLLASAAELGTRAGIPAETVPELIASLASGTFANWQRRGAAESFSGPIARGDIETVRLHLASLAGMPEHDHIYRALAEYGARHLPARRRAQMVRVLQAGRP